MAPPLEFLVIADDLTGALDTGAQFAQAGLHTLVLWEASQAPHAEVLVIDTGTRELPPADARRRLETLVAPWVGVARHLYKKVDSTLRGNVGTELAALLELTGAARAVLAPAFPAQGRTVLDGRLHLHGKPVDLPAGATGGSCATIAALLAARTDLPIAGVPLSLVQGESVALASFLRGCSGRIVVADAVDDADLARLAEAIALVGPDLLPAGSAGLAAHLPKAWGLVGCHRCSLAPASPILLVAGTPHPSLIAQLRQLERQRRAKVVGGLLGALLPQGEAVPAERARMLAAALVAGEDAVLTTCDGPRLAGGGPLVAGLLAEVVRRLVAEVRPGALVMTGGEVASAVCRGLGAAGIAIGGELEPGIPFGRVIGGMADGLPLVTKAGGFGDEETLCRILAALKGDTSPAQEEGYGQH
ncbi:MAG: hypothetical protein K6V36_13595 [Anaerolineae bacterium]|nr:hypothetical protein [Anaerolineae bacterium]